MATARSGAKEHAGGFRRASRAPMRAPLVALLAAALLAAGPAEAQVHGSRTLIFTPAYGVDEDCLEAGGECGRLVADDWCEAKGQGPALHFGRAADDPGRYALACGEPNAAPVAKAGR